MSGEVQIATPRTLQDGQTITYDDLVEILEGMTATILAGAITERELADGSISADKLDAAVASQLGVPDGSITLAKLAAGILTADAAGRAKMADGYVNTAKIEDAAVTAEKLDASLTWPVGIVIPFASETVPTGWLECNGASLLRSSYAALFAAIGTVHGTADATHFNLPDMRGYFVRGWDHGAANDPGAASRTAAATGGATGDHVGTVQADELKAHTHNFKVYASQGTVGSGSARCYNAAGTIYDPVESTGGSETRPKNKSMMFIIKT